MTDGIIFLFLASILSVLLLCDIIMDENKHVNSEGRLKGFLTKTLGEINALFT